LRKSRNLPNSSTFSILREDWWFLTFMANNKWDYGRNSV
jgi:hypothetical protein